jgi:hypothetical protein
MMEAASTSETSVNFYQTTQHYNTEYSHLHTRCHENLKFYRNISLHNHIKVTQSPIQQVLDSLFPRIKWLLREAHNASPTSVNVKVSPCPLYAFMNETSLTTLPLRVVTGLDIM